MKKNSYHSGQGFDYSNEDGKFEVIGKETKQFSKLSEAKKYYKSIKGSKAIWDITNPFPELIDCV